jgi:hypothetical protein
VDDGRKPLEGVRIRLNSYKAERRLSATSDAKGEFKFPQVEVNEGYKLTVDPTSDHGAFESEMFAVDSEDLYFEIELDPAEFADLSGVITDLAGQPLGRFSLWLRGVGTSAQKAVRIETDGAGRFELEDLRAGEIKFESRSEPRLEATNLVLEAGESRHVEIPMDWGKNWLLGQILNTHGLPVSGAQVVLSWEERFWDVTSESRREVRSDLEGYFAVSNLGARDYLLTVRAPGYESKRFQYSMGEAGEEFQFLLEESTAGSGQGGAK